MILYNWEVIRIKTIDHFDLGSYPMNELWFYDNNSPLDDNITVVIV